MGRREGEDEDVEDEERRLGVLLGLKVIGVGLAVAYALLAVWLVAVRHELFRQVLVAIGLCLTAIGVAHVVVGRPQIDHHGDHGDE